MCPWHWEMEVRSLSAQRHVTSDALCSNSCHIVSNVVSSEGLRLSPAKRSSFFPLNSFTACHYHLQPDGISNQPGRWAESAQLYRFKMPPPPFPHQLPGYTFIVVTCVAQTVCVWAVNTVLLLTVGVCLYDLLVSVWNPDASVPVSRCSNGLCTVNFGGPSTDG